MEATAALVSSATCNHSHRGLGGSQKITADHIVPKKKGLNQIMLEANKNKIHSFYFLLDMNY